MSKANGRTGPLPTLTLDKVGGGHDVSATLDGIIRPLSAARYALTATIDGAAQPATSCGDAKSAALSLLTAIGIMQAQGLDGPVVRVFDARAMDATLDAVSVLSTFPEGRDLLKRINPSALSFDGEDRNTALGRALERACARAKTPDALSADAVLSGAHGYSNDLSKIAKDLREGRPAPATRAVGVHDLLARAGLIAWGVSDTATQSVLPRALEPSLTEARDLAAAALSGPGLAGRAARLLNDLSMNATKDGEGRLVLDPNTIGELRAACASALSDGLYDDGTGTDKADLSPGAAYGAVGAVRRLHALAESGSASPDELARPLSSIAAFMLRTQVDPTFEASVASFHGIDVAEMTAAIRAACAATLSMSGDSLTAGASETKALAGAVRASHALRSKMDGTSPNELDTAAGLVRAALDLRPSVGSVITPTGDLTLPDSKVALASSAGALEAIDALCARLGAMPQTTASSRQKFGAKTKAQNTVATVAVMPTAFLSQFPSRAEATWSWELVNSLSERLADLQEAMAETNDTRIPAPILSAALDLCRRAGVPVAPQETLPALAHHLRGVETMGDRPRPDAKATTSAILRALAEDNPKMTRAMRDAAAAAAAEPGGLESRLDAYEPRGLSEDSFDVADASASIGTHSGASAEDGEEVVAALDGLSIAESGGMSERGAFEGEGASVEGDLVIVKKSLIDGISMDLADLASGPAIRALAHATGMSFDDALERSGLSEGATATATNDALVRTASGIESLLSNPVEAAALSSAIGSLRHEADVALRAGTLVIDLDPQSHTATVTLAGAGGVLPISDDEVKGYGQPLPLGTPELAGALEDLAEHLFDSGAQRVPVSVAVPAGTNLAALSLPMQALEASIGFTEIGGQGAKSFVAAPGSSPLAPAVASALTRASAKHAEVKTAARADLRLTVHVGGDVLDPQVVIELYDRRKAVGRGIGKPLVLDGESTGAITIRGESENRIERAARAVEGLLAQIAVEHPNTSIAVGSSVGPAFDPSAISATFGGAFVSGGPGTLELPEGLSLHPMPKERFNEQPFLAQEIVSRAGRRNTAALDRSEALPQVVAMVDHGGVLCLERLVAGDPSPKTTAALRAAWAKGEPLGVAEAMLDEPGLSPEARARLTDLSRMNEGQRAAALAAVLAGAASENPTVAVALLDCASRGVVAETGAEAATLAAMGQKILDASLEQRPHHKDRNDGEVLLDPLAACALVALNAGRSVLETGRAPLALEIEAANRLDAYISEHGATAMVEDLSEHPAFGSAFIDAGHAVDDALSAVLSRPVRRSWEDSTLNPAHAHALDSSAAFGLSAEALRERANDTLKAAAEDLLTRQRAGSRTGTVADDHLPAGMTEQDRIDHFVAQGRRENLAGVKAAMATAETVLRASGLPLSEAALAEMRRVSAITGALRWKKASTALEGRAWYRAAVKGLSDHESREGVLRHTLAVSHDTLGAVLLAHPALNGSARDGMSPDDRAALESANATLSAQTAEPLRASARDALLSVVPEVSAVDAQIAKEAGTTDIAAAAKGSLAADTRALIALEPGISAKDLLDRASSEPSLDERQALAAARLIALLPEAEALVRAGAEKAPSVSVRPAAEPTEDDAAGLSEPETDDATFGPNDNETLLDSASGEDAKAEAEEAESVGTAHSASSVLEGALRPILSAMSSSQSPLGDAVRLSVSALEKGKSGKALANDDADAFKAALGILADLRRLPAASGVPGYDATGRVAGAEGDAALSLAASGALRSAVHDAATTAKGLHSATLSSTLRTVSLDALRSLRGRCSDTPQGQRMAGLLDRALRSKAPNPLEELLASSATTPCLSEATAAAVRKEISSHIAENEESRARGAATASPAVLAETILDTINVHLSMSDDAALEAAISRASEPAVAPVADWTDPALLRRVAHAVDAATLSLREGAKAMAAAGSSVVSPEAVVESFRALPAKAWSDTSVEDLATAAHARLGAYASLEDSEAAKEASVGLASALSTVKTSVERSVATHLRVQARRAEAAAPAAPASGTPLGEHASASDTKVLAALRSFVESRPLDAETRVSDRVAHALRDPNPEKAIATLFDTPHLPALTALEGRPKIAASALNGLKTHALHAAVLVSPSVLDSTEEPWKTLRNDIAEFPGALRSSLGVPASGTEDHAWRNASAVEIDAAKAVARGFDASLKAISTALSEGRISAERADMERDTALAASRGFIAGIYAPDRIVEAQKALDRHFLDHDQPAMCEPLLDAARAGLGEPLPGHVLSDAVLAGGRPALALAKAWSLGGSFAPSSNTLADATLHSGLARIDADASDALRRLTDEGAAMASLSRALREAERGTPPTATVRSWLDNAANVEHVQALPPNILRALQADADSPANVLERMGHLHSANRKAVQAGLIQRTAALCAQVKGLDTVPSTAGVRFNDAFSLSGIAQDKAQAERAHDAAYTRRAGAPTAFVLAEAAHDRLHPRLSDPAKHFTPADRAALDNGISSILAPHAESLRQQAEGVVAGREDEIRRAVLGLLEASAPTSNPDDAALALSHLTAADWLAMTPSEILSEAHRTLAGFGGSPQMDAEFVRDGQTLVSLVKDIHKSLRPLEAASRAAAIHAVALDPTCHNAMRADFVRASVEAAASAVRAVGAANSFGATAEARLAAFEKRKDAMFTQAQWEEVTFQLARDTFRADNTASAHLDAVPKALHPLFNLSADVAVAEISARIGRAMKEIPAARTATLAKAAGYRWDLTVASSETASEAAEVSKHLLGYKDAKDASKSIVGMIPEDVRKRTPEDWALLRMLRGPDDGTNGSSKKDPTRKVAKTDDAPSVATAKAPSAPVEGVPEDIVLSREAVGVLVAFSELIEPKAKKRLSNGLLRPKAWASLDASRIATLDALAQTEAANLSDGKAKALLAGVEAAKTHLTAGWIASTDVATAPRDALSLAKTGVLEISPAEWAAIEPALSARTAIVQAMPANLRARSGQGLALNSDMRRALTALGSFDDKGVQRYAGVDCLVKDIVSLWSKGAVFTPRRGASGIIDSLIVTPDASYKVIHDPDTKVVLAAPNSPTAMVRSKARTMVDAERDYATKGVLGGAAHLARTVSTACAAVGPLVGTAQERAAALTKAIAFTVVSEESSRTRVLGEHYTVAFRPDMPQDLRSVALAERRTRVHAALGLTEPVPPVRPGQHVLDARSLGLVGGGFLPESKMEILRRDAASGLLIVSPTEKTGKFVADLDKNSAALLGTRPVGGIAPITKALFPPLGKDERVVLPSQVAWTRLSNTTRNALVVEKTHLTIDARAAGAAEARLAKDLDSAGADTKAQGRALLACAAAVHGAVVEPRRAKETESAFLARVGTTAEMMASAQSGTLSAKDLALAPKEVSKAGELAFSSNPRHPKAGVSGPAAPSREQRTREAIETGGSATTDSGNGLDIVGAETVEREDSYGDAPTTSDIVSDASAEQKAFLSRLRQRAVDPDNAFGADAAMALPMLVGPGADAVRKSTAAALAAAVEKLAPKTEAVGPISVAPPLDLAALAGGAKGEGRTGVSVLGSAPGDGETARGPKI